MNIFSKWAPKNSNPWFIFESRARIGQLQPAGQVLSQSMYIILIRLSQKYYQCLQIVKYYFICAHYHHPNTAQNNSLLRIPQPCFLQTCPAEQKIRLFGQEQGLSRFVCSSGRMDASRAANNGPARNNCRRRSGPDKASWPVYWAARGSDEWTVPQVHCEGFEELEGRCGVVWRSSALQKWLQDGNYHSE